MKFSRCKCGQYFIFEDRSLKKCVCFCPGCGNEILVGIKKKTKNTEEAKVVALYETDFQSARYTIYNQDGSKTLLKQG